MGFGRMFSYNNSWK